MSSSRLLLILLVLAAAAVGLWFTLDALDEVPQLPGQDALPALAENSLLQLEPSELQRLTLDWPRLNQTLQLERGEDGVWRMTEPFFDWAEPAVVLSAFNALYSQDWGDAQPDWAQQSEAALGLEPAEFAVEVRTRAQKSLVLRIGAGDFAGRWRVAELNGRRIRVGESVVSPLARGIDDWRDHRLQPLAPPAVARLRWTAADGSVLALTRRENRWQVVEPYDAPLDERQAGFVERMLGARAQQLRRESWDERPLRGERLGLLALDGANAHFQLELFTDGVRTSHRDYPMEWAADDFALLFRDPELLRSPQLLAFDPGTVASILTERGEQSAIFRRASGGWSLEGHGQLGAEEAAFLDALLSYGVRIEAVDWQPRPAEPPSGRVAYSISRTPQPGAPALVWWRSSDGSLLVAAEEGKYATVSTVNFDLAVADLFQRIAALPAAPR